MTKHIKRERRYAERAAEVKARARGRLTAAEVLNLLGEHYDLSEEDARQLVRELAQVIDTPHRAVPIAPRLAIVAIPHFEDLDLGELAAWRSGRFLLIDGQPHHVQPAWRRKGGRK